MHDKERRRDKSQHMLFGYPFHSAYRLGSAKESAFLEKDFHHQQGGQKQLVQRTIPPQPALLSFPILYVKHDLTLPSGGTELAWRRETHTAPEVTELPHCLLENLVGKFMPSYSFP